MADWRALVRARLAPLALPPTTELDVIDELAQHLDDCYTHALGAGVTPEEAAARVTAELDSAEFLADLADALREGQP
jgi:hypothetical protein